LTGKLPLVHGHKQQVTAFDLSKYENILATVSTDGPIKLYRIPDEGLSSPLTEEWKELPDLGKISYLQFHPYISEILISSSIDFENLHIKFWNIHSESKEPLYDIVLDRKNEGVEDIGFETSCRHIAITTKELNSLVRIIDVYEGKVTKEFLPRNNRKGTQTRWITNDLLLVVGAKPSGTRSVAVYSLSHPEAPLKDLDIDNANSLMIPFYDPDSMVLWIGSQGGNFIRFFQITTEPPYVEFLSIMDSKGDVTGLSWFPKSVVDIKKVEVMRCVKLTKDRVLPIEWTVPRKRMEFFQDDLYPETLVCPILNVAEFEGKVDASPNYSSLRPRGMEPLSSAPVEELTERQIRYKQQLVDAQKPKAKNAMGHSSVEEVQQHFAQLAEAGPRHNRWDADVFQAPAKDDEWED